MPVKTIFTLEDRLIKVPLPNHASTYTVIPHEFIITESLQELERSGFKVTKKIYKSNIDGSVAHGIYVIAHGSDNDAQMMFAWSNSYDKSMRFKCAIGAVVKVSGNALIHGDMANYSRKHTGNAKTEAHQSIEQQIRGAGAKFKVLMLDKDAMKSIMMTDKTRAEILGRLFAEEANRILTLTQLGIIKREIKTPSYDYGVEPESAWALFNHVSHSLKESHPNDWMDDHRKLHAFFAEEYKGIMSSIADPVHMRQLLGEIQETEFKVEKVAPEPRVLPTYNPDIIIPKSKAQPVHNVSRPKDTKLGRAIQAVIFS